MHITQLKSSRINADLKPVTLVTGPNKSGKTTVLNIIRALMHGHVPSIGKTNGATFLLSSGDRLEAAARFNTGDILKREWREGKSISKRDIEVPEFITQNLITLNVSEYLSLTPGERIRYLFQNSDIAMPYTLEDVYRQLPEPSLVSDSLDNLEGEELLTKITELLDEKKGVVSGEVQYWRKRAADTRGSVRILSELKAQNELYPESIQELEGRLSILRDQASDLKKNQLRTLVDQREAFLKTEEDRERMIEQLKRLTVTKSEIDQAKTKAGTFRQQLGNIENVQIEEREAAKTESAIKSDYSRCKAEYAEALLQRKMLEAMEACPHCGSDQDGWKSGLLKTINEKLGTLEESGHKLKAQYSHATKALKEASDRVAQSSLLQKMEMEVAQMESDLSLKERIQEKLDSSPKPVDDNLIQETQEKLNRLAEEGTTLKERLSAVVKLRNEIAMAAKAESEHCQAKNRFEVYEATQAALRSIQKKAVDSLFGTLTEQIKQFTGKLIPGLTYHEGEFGYFNGSRFVTYKTFSGTEQLIFHIGLSSALARKDGFKLVMADEFDVDEENWPEVLQVILNAIAAGHLDQVILSGTDIGKGIEDNETISVVRL